LQGQPQEWVSLPSGRVVSNVIGLCRRHHNEVTGGPGGHKAMIQLAPEERFIWLTPDGNGWVHHGLLFPQPFSETPVDRPSVKKKAHSHPDLEPGETCQSCGYTRPLGKKSEPGPKRRAKSYTMRVPDDTEIGSDVLDDWVSQFATILGFGEDAQKSLTRYHVFTVVLAWAMQHRQEFIKDISEANAA